MSKVTQALEQAIRDRRQQPHRRSRDVIFIAWGGGLVVLVLSIGFSWLASLGHHVEELQDRVESLKQHVDQFERHPLPRVPSGRLVPPTGETMHRRCFDEQTWRERPCP